MKFGVMFKIADIIIKALSKAPFRDGAFREEMLGDKKCQSADSERASNIFTDCTLIGSKFDTTL